ncbi:MAG: CBS domain-containing protein [Verrucomicrobia bacterium]|nr:CBS domain-containing protein [Verrucomicrobiota bacterium]
MTTVRQLLKEKKEGTWTISPNASVYQALEMMAQKDIGSLAVVDDQGKLVGMFSERDYARKIALLGRTSKTTAVAALMTTKIFYVKPDSTVEECMALMTDTRTRHLPVLDNGKLTGLVSIGDIVKAFITEQEITIRSLQNYITGSYEL